MEFLRNTSIKLQKQFCKNSINWSYYTHFVTIVDLIQGGIGGKGGTYEKRLDSMEMLDLECIDWKASKRDRIKNGAKWKIITPMSTPRSSHSVAAVDGIIYVVGGGDGKEWLCSAEAYNTKTQKWASISR